MIWPQVYLLLLFMIDFFFFDFCYIQDQIMKYSIQVVDNVYMLKKTFTLVWIFKANVRVVYSANIFSLLLWWRLWDEHASYGSCDGCLRNLRSYLGSTYTNMVWYSERCDLPSKRHEWQLKRYTSWHKECFLNHKLQLKRYASIAILSSYNTAK